MFGMVMWTRSFNYKNGQIVMSKGSPVFSAHPQPLYPLLKSLAKELVSAGIRTAQTAPVTNGPGEGYSAFCLRNFNSNWGTETELVDCCESCDGDGLQVDFDIAVRQMTGSNGPNVWDYTYPDYEGSTSGGWFAYYGQLGEAKPPMVDQDDVIDPSGNFAFGTVRANQHSNPAGAVMNDTISALKLLGKIFRLKNPRFDDPKGMWALAVKAYLEALLPAKCVCEMFSGSNAELYWFVHTLMGGICQVEDYGQYWPLQRMANGYDCTQFEEGYWSWDSPNAVGFVNNPDVATSWDWYNGGAISQQIAFNLLLMYAVGMGLPYQRFMIYAEDYFPASANYPTGRGYKPYIDNMLWFFEMFAFGGFQVRWKDKDVLVYTRDGDGGSIGWSGGCLVAININTYTTRNVTVQTTWPEGHVVHNYSMTGKDETATVGAGGKLALTLHNNAYSNGQSYQLWATAGVK